MEKAADKALDLLQQLAQKLGTTLEQIYPILVRQALLEGFIYLLAGCFIVVAALGGSVFLFHWKSKAESYYYRGDQEWIARGFAIALLSVGLIVLAFLLADNLPKIINPEYYAVKELMGLVK